MIQATTEVSEAPIDHPSDEVAAMEWRPIETAPKDGDVFIIGRTGGGWANRAYSGLAHWNGHGFCDHDDEVAYWYQPTHWMPIPSPPVTGEASGLQADR